MTAIKREDGLGLQQREKECIFLLFFQIRVEGVQSPRAVNYTSIKKEDFSTKVVIPQILLLLFSHFCVVTGSRPGEMDTPRIA